MNMMYAKMDRKTIVKYWGAETYARYELNINLEGGLGHAFYEITRTFGEGSSLGQEASQVSRDYYLRCKNTLRKPLPPRADFLKLQLEALKKRVPHVLHKGKEAVPEYMALNPADSSEDEI
ncbi:MAG: hypothetical protein EOO22_13965 [Comamonadaceae bacterium]|nr:MAG: hypothetical protein EOO22_13965 [Comamonadaceae bacterium]